MESNKQKLHAFSAAVYNECQVLNPLLSLRKLATFGSSELVLLVFLHRSVMRIMQSHTGTLAAPRHTGASQ